MSDDGDLWADFDNAPKRNRKQRRANEKRVDRSVRIRLFERGGKHRSKSFRTKKGE